MNLKTASLLLGSIIIGGLDAASISVPVSSNQTIIQNLMSLAQSGGSPSVSYLSLLLSLNSSCTSNVSSLLNSTGNWTFFAPSDSAFMAIPGFPDFGPSCCRLCDKGNSSRCTSSPLFQARKSLGQQCPVGCNSTSVGYTATSARLMPCLSQILQYHILNGSYSFNETSFGFLNRSESNYTVSPTMLNSSCLVSLSNSSGNSQVLGFNITNSAMNASSLASSSMSFPNVTILHGINMPANITVFDIESSNGVLHIIDALLIPPANFSQTVNTTYMNAARSASNDGSTTLFPPLLNSTDLEMISNMTGITVFLPDLRSFNASFSSSNDSSSLSGFNIADHVFPQVLYNNQSIETVGNLSKGVFAFQNLTNLNGQNVTVFFGRNNSMLFNGSQVTESNILMDNGVMHLFDASTLLVQQPQSSSMLRSLLGGIFNHIF